MVMVWLEGGQGEVRGAYVPPPPHPKSLRLDPPQPTLLDPPPISPPPDPPLPCPPPPPPPPPQGASGQQLVGGVVGVQNRGVAPPGVSRDVSPRLWGHRCSFSVRWRQAACLLTSLQKCCVLACSTASRTWDSRPETR